MEQKKYIMVGAPIITKELFRNTLRPLNNYNFDITGGFWSSEYINESYNISDWFTYLRQVYEIAVQKNLNQSTIFSLKENTKILTIDSPQVIQNLANKYPSYHYLLGYFDTPIKKDIVFDFEKLSQDYDGIYVNKKNLGYYINSSIFRDWVNSLVLFNLDCIKEYQTAPIIYDKDNPYSIPYIDMTQISDYQQIEEESYEHRMLSLLAKQIYLELISKYDTFSFEDYDEYFTTITQTIKNVISTIIQNEETKINKIISYLQSKNITTNKEIVISNIVLNYLTKYLIQDEERIKNLPKSKTKNLKWYPVI